VLPSAAEATGATALGEPAGGAAGDAAGGAAEDAEIAAAVAAGEVALSAAETCLPSPSSQAVSQSVSLAHTRPWHGRRGTRTRGTHGADTRGGVCDLRRGLEVAEVQSQQCGGERDEIRDSSSQAASQKSHAPSHKSDVSQVGVAAPISRGEGVGEAPAKLLGGVL